MAGMAGEGFALYRKLRVGMCLPGFPSANPKNLPITNGIIALLDDGQAGAFGFVVVTAVAIAVIGSSGGQFAWFDT